MAKEQLAVIEMITNMILGKTNGVSKVDFTLQKIPFPENLPYEQAFLRATPESQGVSSEKLIHLLSNLSASPYTDVSAIDKARAKGVIKKNTASRKISRMAKRANKNA